MLTPKKSFPDLSPDLAAAPLATLDRASVSLGGRRILDAVSFRLFPGQAWAVLGRNGAGKTTFLRLVRGDIPPDQDGAGRRRYVADGRDQSTALGLRQRFGSVSRPDWDFWRGHEGTVTVFDAVCAGFFDSRLLHQPPTPHERLRAREVIGQVGLAGLEEAPMAALSEGRLRAALVARALAPWPLLLILDEVLDGLDADNRARVLGAMAVAAASGTALLATAHRPEDVPPGVTRAVVLEQGRIVACGLLSDMPFSGTADDGSQAEAASAASAASAGPAGPARADAAPPLFEIENADVFLAGRRVLTGLTWRVMPGEGWAVLGPNGAGKTTLLRLILGEIHPAEGGAIRRPGLVELAGTDLRDIKARVGFVSADLESAYPPHTTVCDVAASGFFAGVGLFFTPSQAQAQAVRTTLAGFGLADLAARPLASLSTGQRRLAFLARAVVHSPQLLILDEPFSSLDAAARDTAACAVQGIMARGAAVILVTHRARDILPGIGRVLRLERGRASIAAAPRVEAQGSNRL
ncbi:ATP-binding cassette domain-containing protein [Desulfovibrio sulfodismutans]|uniref:ATP-binding cassette domain-containing protein n=1 Tax=Desulfolutivibrio sulfodismutans TaxID=63561 RepID=A0A7K3NQD2_9BACT|nr:ATP-binding cassette domain-containing protein [Desulfolutivibrio sulfodismutans]NDY58416.1 ATP-binding cassette domain-containing protein [Desulfolutivibrio sulfodismutans]QLA13971.1 ATP-binding cassette domain-containing protein [Desulfolutivibrio sulfodismutans DSM 3696]